MTYAAAEAVDGWLTIQEASQRTGLSEPTLRYYERVGLIEPVPRDPSSRHRRYSADIVENIEALACLRATGMGIEDMRRYLAGLDGDSAATADMVDLFEGHATRIAAEIEAMKVRYEYARAKAELWRARRDGRPRAESAAAARVISVMQRLRAGL